MMGKDGAARVLPCMEMEERVVSHTNPDTLFRNREGLMALSVGTFNLGFLAAASVFYGYESEEDFGSLVSDY